MRRFMAFIIATLILTGFDSATHVFGAALAGDPSDQAESAMESMECCPDARAEKMSDISCHYCCATLTAIGKPVLTPAAPPRVRLRPAALKPSLSDFVYLLLRPPRALT